MHQNEVRGKTEKKIETIKIKCFTAYFFNLQTYLQTLSEGHTTTSTLKIFSSKHAEKKWCNGF